MTAYELMIKTNHYLIKGGSLSEKQKTGIVTQLLAALNTPDQEKEFYSGVKKPSKKDTDGRSMYPYFYTPAYNDGKKLKTILGQTPKTHILSDNMYELEILRLLHMLAPEDDRVKYMINETSNRLKTTCFGYQQCGIGECYDASLLVLRFISTVAPDDKDWIKSRINNYYKHFHKKKRPWFVEWYYWLCLSEMPLDIALSEIDKYKDVMLNM